MTIKTPEYEVWQMVYQLSNIIRKLKYNNEKVDETVLWKLEDIEQELMDSAAALANMEKMRKQAARAEEERNNENYSRI